MLVSPRARVAEMTAPLLNPSAYLRPWAMCALFAAFFLVSYLTLGPRWSMARAEERA